MDKLRAMALLVATAETGSFSHAGRRHGLSPASVSRQIGELETVLGVTLVHRSTRNMALSEAGRLYVAQAEAILSAVDAADAGMTALQRTPKGLLRVHSRTMFGVCVLAPLQVEFARRYPGVTVELHLDERPARLREDGFDLDFRIAPPQEPGLMRRRLFLSERLVVAAPGYLEHAPPITGPRDVLAHNCLVYWLNGDPVSWRFKKEHAVEELRIPANFVSNNGLVLLAAARAGQGLALLDDYTVADDLRSGSLVRVLADHKITNSTFEEGIFAAFLETLQIPLKLRVYLDFVSESWAARAATIAGT
ncbi:MAG: LysR family transcriptional regulator [Burkholderiaceae bacterium]